MYACNCRAWLRNWPRLQNTFTMAWVQDAGYQGAAFKNCPWCGATLRLGLPYTVDEQAIIEEEETVELPPKKPKNFLY